MPNTVRASAPHAIVGLCVMGLGIALVLDRFGVIRAEQVLPYWPVGLVLLGAAMVFQALWGGPDPGVRYNFPIGAVVWLVLLGMFFTHVFERRAVTAPGGSGRVYLFAVMGGDNRGIIEPFEGADVTAVMGGVKLDLTRAQVKPGADVVVDLFTMMGGAVLVVPKDWRVELQTMSFMGGANDNRSLPPGSDPGGRGRRPRREGVDVDVPPAPPPQAQAPAPPAAPPPVERPDQAAPSPTAPRLIVRGTVILGGVTIKS